MKTISLKKSMAMALAIVMALALCVVPAFAADSNYTAVAGTNTSFNKVLIMDENANVPTIDFEFSIAPGSAIAYDVNGQKIAVYAGDNAAVSGAPTMSGNGGANKVSFAPGHATVTSQADADIDAGEKAAVEAITVDFSGVTFAEPGIYRWLVNETSADQQGISYDTQAAQAGSKQRVLDVYVVDNNGALEVASYVLHESVSEPPMGADFGSGEVDAAGDAVEDKSSCFVNELQTYDIDLSKAVSGNQASKDKYFAFQVAITNAGPNADLEVIVTENAKDPVKSVATVYAAADMKAANEADDDANVTGQQWKTDANGDVTKTVYLKHGQNIQIKGLTAGAQYTITETPEDYKPSSVQQKGEDIAAVAATEWYVDGNESAPFNSEAEALEAAENDASRVSDNGVAAVTATRVNGTTAVVAESTGMDADHDIDYTNTRNGNVPTGVMLSVIPGVALLGIGGGAIFAASRKKKEDEE